MLVRQAVALLLAMPQDAVLVAAEGPLKQQAHPKSFRENAPPASAALVDGFSAEELRGEDYDFFLFEKENIVALAMTVRGDGQQVG